ncbi:MAG TPA: tetratricopeptide repeat protein [Azospirillaceae bacterium]|nr:tetratricopeptide repeat protein [Azospirillaceae bacterium]
MVTVAEALHIAATHHQQGRLDQAHGIYEKVLEVDPGNGDALYLLGILYRAQKHFDQATDLLRRAITVTPDRAVNHSALGNALRDQGKLEEAIAAFRAAADLDPGFVIALDSLAVANFALGRMAEVERAYRELVAQQPSYAIAWQGLGVVLKRQNRAAEAIEAYDRALALDPGNALTHYYRALALNVLDRCDEAFDSYRHAIVLKPDMADAYINVAHHFQDHRRLDEARLFYEKAIALEPDSSDVHSNLMLTAQYLPGASLDWLHHIHRRWNDRHGAPLKSTWQPFANTPTPERRLRIGFISADLGRHPVGYFMARVLRHLDAAQTEIFIYSDRVGPGATTRRVPDPAGRDGMTDHLQSLAHHWCDSVGLNAGELAERVRADGIDILFDLSGHTANNRLIVFARKPAPIQITWAGYVGTTGLEAMDYLIADRFHVPPEHDRYMHEKVIRLPDGYICYQPPAYDLPVGPLPALERGPVTFGAYNNPTKLMPETIATWARILTRVPSARLIMRYRGLEKGRIRRWIQDTFAENGVETKRVELLQELPHDRLMASYGEEIDIALDSFPYSGGLTTCEAMWMGVPVVTRPGDIFASRHSFSHLSNVGLTETIARDLDEYVDIAVSLATDLPRLAAIRAGLRNRMAASPLCDGERFARNFEAAMRQIWRDWCAGM